MNERGGEPPWTTTRTTTLAEPVVTVEIRGLSLYTHHGVDAAEREVGQRLVFDLSFDVGDCDATVTDRVEDTVDYADVCEQVALAAPERSYKTLEALCSYDRGPADRALRRQRGERARRQARAADPAAGRGGRGRGVEGRPLPTRGSRAGRRSRRARRLRPPRWAPTGVPAVDVLDGLADVVDDAGLPGSAAPVARASPPPPPPPGGAGLDAVPARAAAAAAGRRDVAPPGACRRRRRRRHLGAGDVVPAPPVPDARAAAASCVTASPISASLSSIVTSLPAALGPDTTCESPPRPLSPLPPTARQGQGDQDRHRHDHRSPGGPQRLSQPRPDEVHGPIVGRMRKLSIGRAVWVGLLGVTLVLGAVSAFAVAGIFDARQDYEDKLADSYELQVSAGAAADRRRAGGGGPAAARASAPRGRARSRGRRSRRRRARPRAWPPPTPRAPDREAPDRGAGARPRASAQSGPGRPDAPDPLGSALLTARALSRELSARQEERRDEARDEAHDDTRRSVIIAVVAGLGALLGAVALIALLVASMRRPLDDLVGATGKLAGGDLDSASSRRARASCATSACRSTRWPSELDTAHRRLVEERERLAVTIESLGDALVVCDADGTVASVEPARARARAALCAGASARGTGLAAARARRGAARGEVMRRARRPHPGGHRRRARGRERGRRVDDPRHLRARPARAHEVGVRGHRLARAAQPADLDQGLRRAAGALGRARREAARVRRRDPALDRTAWSTW